MVRQADTNTILDLRRSDLLGETVDKRHVYAACLNTRDAESHCRAACVLELLWLSAIYYIFGIIS